ncbi:MAG TPA: hypothetical protein PKX48_14810 [Planctomycetota bacterium]|nr:hypothetical protein [Planctomycetota bacterium]HOE31211.1 hypothetical protein [Planctomycetota bacterium]HOE88116.1 hypothetical protein [Planctomycetota bacterium]HOR68984.1 hypothetical protein [Planctomycetota bacterium]HPL61928.1 hypothetical protein [Planctomycetota bacterium]
MTIDLWVERTDDVFLPNDVICLKPRRRASRTQIAAAVWVLAGERPVVAHLHAFRAATSTIVQRLPGYSFWLLAAHTAWQPDSRVYRYRNRTIWGSLKASGLAIPPGRVIEEGLVEGENGLRFFGALQFEIDYIESVAAILEAESASQLVALQQTNMEAIAALVRSGWDRAPFGPPAVVLDTVCDADGVCLYQVGEFDDYEAGCAAFGKIEVIYRMLIDRLSDRRRRGP